MKPFYAAIDGIDGCGKTTQIKLLSDYLAGLNIPFYVTKEPGGTDVGGILRKILISKDYHVEPETELLLYSADRLEHQKKVVIPNMHKGYSVISDRFISSTYAYQVFGRGLDRSLLDFLRNISVSIYPDVTIIIDIEPSVALERAKNRLKKYGMMEKEGKFESLNIDFYAKVRDGFLWYADNFRNVVVLDGNKSIESLFGDIKNRINEFINDIWV